MLDMNKSRVVELQHDFFCGTTIDRQVSDYAILFACYLSI